MGRMFEVEARKKWGGREGRKGQIYKRTSPPSKQIDRREMKARQEMVEIVAAIAIQHAYKSYKSHEMLGKLLWKAKLHIQKMVLFFLAIFCSYEIVQAPLPSLPASSGYEGERATRSENSAIVAWEKTAGEVFLINSWPH